MPALQADARRHTQKGLYEHKPPRQWFVSVIPTRASAHDAPGTPVSALNSATPNSALGKLLAARGPLGLEVLPIALQDKDPFSDVKLGKLLGKGAFGSVYRGSWDGASTGGAARTTMAHMAHGFLCLPSLAVSGAVVAVKVLEHSAKKLVAPAEGSHADDDAVPGASTLEAILSVNIAHPNLVQSFKYATRPVVLPDVGGLTDDSESLLKVVCHAGCELTTSPSPRPCCSADGDLDRPAVL